MLPVLKQHIPVSFSAEREFNLSEYSEIKLNHII